MLNDEQVKALEGKVEFKTRYETRTRVVDDAGNEVPVPADQLAGHGVAPPHPDVEGAERSTKQAKRDEPIRGQDEAIKSKDGEKEAAKEKPKPGSEGNEATANANAQ